MIAVRRRHGWLLLIAGLHVAVLVSWRFTATRAVPAMRQREGELVFLAQTPSSQMKAEPPHLRTAVPHPRHSSPAVLAPAAPPAPTASAASAVPQPEPPAPDPFAQPAPVAQSLGERARLAAIGVDRELRKESKNDNDRVLAHEPKLAQDIALAYKGSGAFSMAETVLPNGDSLARVTTPLGSYCILKRGNRDKAGLDAIGNAGKTYIVRCPK